MAEHGAPDALSWQQHAVRYSATSSWIHSFEEQQSRLFILDTPASRGDGANIILQPALHIRSRGDVVEFIACTSNAQRWFDWVVARLPHFRKVSIDADCLRMRFQYKPHRSLPGILRNLDALRIFCWQSDDQSPQLLLGGYFAYDLVARAGSTKTESASTAKDTSAKDTIEKDSMGLPDFEFYLAETWLEVDHHSKTSVIHSCGLVDDDMEWAEQRHRLVDYADRYEWALNQKLHLESRLASLKPGASGHAFRNWVKQARQCVEAGEVQHILLSRSVSFDCADPLANYLYMCGRTLAADRYYIRSPEVQVYGASDTRVLDFNASNRAVQAWPQIGLMQCKAMPGTSDKSEAWLDLAVSLGDKYKAAMRTMGEMGRRGAHVQLEKNPPGYPFSFLVHGQLSGSLDALGMFELGLRVGSYTEADKTNELAFVRDCQTSRRDIYGGTIAVLRGDGSMHGSVANHCVVIRDDVARGFTAIIIETGDSYGESVVRSDSEQNDYWYQMQMSSTY